MAAVWLVSVVALLAALPAQEPGEPTFEQRVRGLYASIGERGLIRAEHVEPFEALLAAMPETLTERENAALVGLAGRLAKRALEGATAAVWQPRWVACCERLAAHGALGLSSAYLWLAIGEARFVVEDSDAAVASFHRAAGIALGAKLDSHRPWREATVAHAQERAFRVELSRQRLRAASTELAAAQLEQAAARCLERAEKESDPAVRQQQLWGADAFRARHELTQAHLALRIGLFDSSSRHLASCEELLARLPPGQLPDERDQAVLVAMELALLREDPARMGELAASLLARGVDNELVVERARLREQQANIARGEVVSLDPLQRLFAAASSLNRPSIALDLVAQAVRRGDEAVAATTVTELLAGRGLRDPTVGLWTLLTVGYHELRPDRMPAVDSPRWREWEAALARAWQELIDEWHGTAVEAESLAFLQLAVRRDLLTFWMRTRLLAPDGARACVQRYLEADASGSTARRLGARDFAVDDVVRTLVPPDGALLVFLPAPSGSHALYLGHDGVHVEPLPPEGGLRQRVFALRRAVAAADGATATTVLRGLAEPIAAQLLPATLQTRLRGKRHLLVAGYELLHSLPIEWLPLEDGDFFGVRHAVTYLPSIALAMHLARRPLEPAAPRAVLLAGTEVADGDRERWGKEPVHVTERELQRSLAALASDAVAIRRAATTGDLVPVPRPGLQAVVTHGIFDGKRPCPGGMLLAAGTERSTGAVFATDLPTSGAPRVVYLGVCGASRSALRLGEDGGHRLTGAWLMGGSDAVVATDFDIRLDEALQLLGAFVAALVDGADVASALWRARQQVAAAGAHPRVWGGMRLEGLPLVTVPLPAAPPWRWIEASILVALVAMAMLGWWLLRLRAAR